MSRTLRAVLFAAVAACLPFADALGDSLSDRSSGEAHRAGSPTPAESAALQTELINRETRAVWQDHGARVAPLAEDGEWCRRVYLDVLGRIPTSEEAQSFVADRAKDKRAKLVDRLLGPESAEAYADHWATVWTNLLIGRTGGTTNDSLASRAGMEQYLRRSFQQNKPYDQMMEELVTASGSCLPGDEDYNGAANFLADKMAEGGVQATAKTSQVFLGVAVQCTQCHNHPFNEHKQNQFWELNAFFRQTVLTTEEIGENRRYARIADRDFAGEGGDIRKAELYYELRNGKLKVAYPVFITGASLAALYADRGEDFGDSGRLQDVHRRKELAKLIRGSDEFPRAQVNRAWGYFLGYGLTRPVDDMGPHNAPSHPALLEGLARGFRESGFDLKALTRWIVLSEPYALSSRAPRGQTPDDPASGSAPLFTRFYLRQMQAEQLYASLLVATRADQNLDYAQRQQARQQWLNQFNTAFGNDENGEATSFNGSIPQALTMMNGDLMRAATGVERGSLLWRLAADGSLSGREKVARLYWAALTREPTRDELALCNQALAAQRGDALGALQDVWWALLNTNEFILIH